MTNRKLPTRTGVTYVRDDGLLCFVASPEHEHGQREALHNVEVAFELLGQRKVPTLVDLRNTGPVSFGARQVYMNETTYASALALLVGSSFTRVVANLFLRLMQSDRPAQMFIDEDEAIRWLHSQW